jgi:hypothetical protein
VRRGVEVKRSGRDILIGDPQAVDCAGNVIGRGDLRVLNNSTNVELVVRGNKLRRGDLEVKGNTGTSEKFVQGNRGGRRLTCRGNANPFADSGNAGWDKKSGQCG